MNTHTDVLDSDDTSQLNFIKLADTKITQAYAELNVKMILINLIVRESDYNWTRFLRTHD